MNWSHAIEKAVSKISKKITPFDHSNRILLNEYNSRRLSHVSSYSRKE